MPKEEEKKFALEELEVKREMAKIARGRLEFDKAQAASEKKFWKMGSGTRVTILLSAAAMILGAIVSASNVWVSKITKDKEIEVSRIQKQFELEKFDTQKKREWDLALAQFVLTNQKAIFNGTPEEQKVLARIIPAAFPDDISATLLERLEKASPQPEKAIWSRARATLETSNESQSKEVAAVDATSVTPGKTSPPSATNSLTYNPINIDDLIKFRPLSSADSPFRSSLSGSLVSEPITIPVSLSNQGSGGMTDALYRWPASIGSPTLADLNKVLSPGGSNLAIPSVVEPSPTSVSGSVIDAETGQPVSGATVEIRNTNIGLTNGRSTTDLLGNFRIEIPSNSSILIFGRSDLTVTGSGYRSAAKEVTVLGSLPVSMGSIRLQKETPAISAVPPPQP